MSFDVKTNKGLYSAEFKPALDVLLSLKETLGIPDDIKFDISNVINKIKKYSEQRIENKQINPESFIGKFIGEEYRGVVLKVEYILTGTDDEIWRELIKVKEFAGVVVRNCSCAFVGTDIYGDKDFHLCKELKRIVVFEPDALSKLYAHNKNTLETSIQTYKNDIKERNQLLEKLEKQKKKYGIE